MLREKERENSDSARSSEQTQDVVRVWHSRGLDWPESIPLALCLTVFYSHRTLTHTYIHTHTHTHTHTLTHITHT